MGRMAERKSLPFTKTPRVDDRLPATSKQTDFGPSFGGLITVAAVCDVLQADLRSTGGRPARAEAIYSRRIPMTEKESASLGSITTMVRAQGVNATASQVAGVLLKVAMESVLTSAKVSPVKRGSSITELRATVERVLAAAASAKQNLEELRPVADELLRKMKSGKGIENDPSQ